MEKGTISSIQVFVLLFIALNGTGVLSAPSLLAIAAGSNSWAAPFVAATTGFIALWLAIALHQRYPGDNLIGYSEKIAGSFFGRLVSLLYLSFTLFTTGWVLRQFSEFITNCFLVRTPGAVVSASLLIVCALTVKLGVEVLGRLGLFFIPIFLGLSLFVLIPMLWNLHGRFALPLLGEGWKATFSGAYALQLWFPLTTFVSYYIPYVRDRERLLSRGLVAILILAIWFSVTNLFTLLTLGPAASSFNYPIMLIVRQIEFSEFVEHLDPLIMMGWVLAFYIRMIFTLYGASVAFAQWLKLPDYRPLVYALALLILIVSKWGIPNSQTLPNAVQEIDLYYMFSGIGVPLLLLLLSEAKRKWTPKATESGEMGEAK